MSTSFSASWNHMFHWKNAKFISSPSPSGLNTSTITVPGPVAVSLSSICSATARSTACTCSSSCSTCLSCWVRPPTSPNILDLNVPHLVPVTKDVGSIATEQVDVFFAVKVPHFAPFCPRVELTRVFSHHKPFVLQIQLVCWSLHKGVAGLWLGEKCWSRTRWSAIFKMYFHLWIVWW